MEREEIIKIYNQGVDAVVELVQGLITGFNEKIEPLETRISELEKQISKNSSNSSKPPSTDGFKKTIKNNRGKSNKKSGGQKGHQGHKLEMVENPDEIIPITVENCKNCGLDLKTQNKKQTKRQVFDIPPLDIFVTEYLTESITCPCCKTLNNTEFPEHVKRPTQYGANFKSLIVYLNQYQFIPYDRTVQFVSDIFNHSFSQGTVYNIIKDCYNNLKSTEEIIKEKILNSPVVHFDESGGYCDKIRDWFHVASTTTLTYFGFHKNRGRKAMNEMNIIPSFKGKAVHDFYPSYFTYDMEHILCNAHLLRELKFLHEEENHKWAFDLEKLILQIKQDVDKEKENPYKNCLSKYKQNKYNEQFDKIISTGLSKNPKNKGRPGKRGRKAQSTARNLLDRLEEWKASYLGFMTDFSIPFDNNLAERDIRMLKLQQKISGTFRSKKGADFFCRIRGYISTARKNNIDIFQAIRIAFTGNPETIVENR